MTYRCQSGGVEETVTVTAAGPIVDTKTSTIDTRFDSEMLAKLPTSRDAFYDLALTAPGMSEGSGAPSQATEFQSPTAYGSATNENVFLINGVDATSPRAGSFGSLVNVNYDAVEEVRIVSTGSKAEYAQLLRRGHRRADQVRQQRISRHRSVVLEAWNGRRQFTRRRGDVRDGLPVRGRGLQLR